MFSNFLESLYDDDDDSDNLTNPNSSPSPETPNSVNRSSPEEEESQSRGVKDDLTELGNTLTRQFLGVANFLAPLPDGSPSSSSDPSNHQSSDPKLNQQSRTESSVSDNKPEIQNTVNSWNNEEEEESDEEEEIDAVALTDEVLAFARNIAMHPETWLDFPLDPDDDLDELEMSEEQRGHAIAIERLAPRLAALRIELCPCHMSVAYFWKVYFVLLLSRLNKHDATLLSSPQVMEARALWMKELQNQTRALKDVVEEEITQSTSNYYQNAPPEFLSPRIYAFEPPSIIYHDYETGNRVSDDDDNVQFTEEKLSQKDEKGNAGISQTKKDNDEDDDDDDWPEEEEDLTNPWAPMYTGNEDDFSFSDLEGDDDISSLALKSKTTSKSTDQK